MSELALPSTADRAFLTFREQGRLYGIDLSLVREVSTQTACTRVPQTAPIVRGLANLRSRIYLVIDTGAALYGRPTECTAESRLVVLNERVGEQLAIVVERGGDIVRVFGDQIEAPTRPMNSGNARFPGRVAAICKLEGELMLEFDPASLIADLQVSVRGRTAVGAVETSDAREA